MKKHFSYILGFFIISELISAQDSTAIKEFKPNGKAFGTVFWNYHVDLTKNVEKRSTFDLERAYLGYKYQFGEQISAKVTFDGSRLSDASVFTVILKHAQLDWQIIPSLKLTGGLMGLNQFDDQEKQWGYRYVQKPMQDEFGFGISADLGINAEISVTEIFIINAFVLNGEGFTNFQDDYGMHKFGANIILKPVESLKLKAYYSANTNKYDMYGNDSVIVDTCAIHNAGIFAGFEHSIFRLAIEYALMLNGIKYNAPAKDHHLNGFAVYGTYVINKNFEVFGTIMTIVSNKSEGEDESRDIDKDGSLLLFGIQYTPVKGVRTALNYRTRLFTHSEPDPGNLIYFNFEFSF